MEMQVNRSTTPTTLEEFREHRHLQSPQQRLRTTPNMPRTISNNLPEQPSPSSSIFSLPIQDAVPPSHSIQSEDIIPPTEPQDTACPAPPRSTHSPVQSSNISSCSEVEAFLAESQQQPARRRARKRRRITSKLSLSQSSHKQEQSPQTLGDVQILAEVHHIPSSGSSSSTSSTTSSSSSSSTTSSSSTSTSHLHTNRNPAPSTNCNVSMQDTSFESHNLLTSFVARGVQQHARPTKQCEARHTLSHRQAQLTRQGIKAGTVKSIRDAATEKQYKGNNADVCQGRKVTFQSPIVAVVHGSGGCCEPDSHGRLPVPSAARQETITLVSTSDSDQSVYYEAFSTLNILDESCAGPSGIQDNLQPATGQTLLPSTQRGDADTSSSSFSQRESDYTSHSFSSSGSSTCVGSLFNTVITNKQQADTFSRPAGKAYKEKIHPTDQKQNRRRDPQLSRVWDKKQLNPQPKTSRKMPPTSKWSWEKHKQEHREMRPPDKTKSTWQTMEAEVSSSTSEPQSEGELSGQQVQGAKRPPPMKAASRLEGSNVSSSSSSSSSVLTQEGMGCIQTIGEVFKDYFGGTVEDNLSLLQRNNFNLLQCIMDLQAAPHLPNTTLPHHPSPPPPASPP